VRVSSRTEYILFLCFLSGFFLLSAYPAHADGVHLVRIESMDGGMWQVSEYLDNSLLEAQPGDNSTDAVILRPALTAGNNEPVIVSAGSEPLVTYFNTHISALEERLADDYVNTEKIKLDRESSEQLVSILFRIPAWPYIATTELPFGLVDFSVRTGVEYERKSSFPAANYSGSMNVSSWEVMHYDGNTAELAEVEGDGTGRGIVLEYIINTGLTELGFDYRDSATISALYIVAENPWSFSNTGRQLSSWQLLGYLDEASAELPSDMVYASDLISNGGSVVGRHLVTGETDEPLRLVGSDAATLENDGITDPGSINTSLVIVACWISFSLLIVLMNFLFKFSRFDTIELAIRSLLIYPLFLFMSLITAGFWGLGFIPAAIFVQRLISVKGSELYASSAVIAGCFIVMFISLIIIP